MIDSVVETSSEWLPLRVAARQMGVSPATLRAWANEGRVETYRTPGGHRRFRLGQTDAALKVEKPREGVPWRLFKLSALGRVQLGLETQSFPSRLAELPPAARTAYHKLGRDAIDVLTRALQKQEHVESAAVALGQAYAKLHWQHSVALTDAVAALDFFRRILVESVVEFAFGVGEPEVDSLIAWLSRTNEIIDRICVSMLEYRAEEVPARARKAPR